MITGTPFGAELYRTAGRFDPFLGEGGTIAIFFCEFRPLETCMGHFPGTFGVVRSGFKSRLGLVINFLGTGGAFLGNCFLPENRNGKKDTSDKQKPPKSCICLTAASRFWGMHPRNDEIIRYCHHVALTYSERREIGTENI